MWICSPFTTTGKAKWPLSTATDRKRKVTLPECIRRRPDLGIYKVIRVTTLSAKHAGGWVRERRRKSVWFRTSARLARSVKRSQLFTFCTSVDSEAAHADSRRFCNSRKCNEELWYRFNEYWLIHVGVKVTWAMFLHALHSHPFTIQFIRVRIFPDLENSLTWYS